MYLKMSSAKCRPSCLRLNVLKAWFSNSLYKYVAWALAAWLLSNECHIEPHWWKVNTDSGNGLELRQQAITVANIYTDQCRHHDMTSHGHNDLTYIYIKYNGACISNYIHVFLCGFIHSQTSTAFHRTLDCACNYLPCWHIPGDIPIGCTS